MHNILSIYFGASIPLMWASIRGLFSERSGVTNIGLEGAMTLGAFIGALVFQGSESLLWGFTAVILTGMVMGSLMSLLVERGTIRALLVGLALNLSITSGVGLALKGFFPGKWFFSVPPVPMTDMNLSWLLFVLGLLLILAYHQVLYRLKMGAEILATGDNVELAGMHGCPTSRIRTLSLMFGCAAAGIGGFFLPLSVGQFTSRDMVAGRGYMALLLVIASGWRPLSVLLWSSLLGILWSWRDLSPKTSGPAQFFEAAPWIVLLAFVLAKRTFHPPRELDVT